MIYIQDPDDDVKAARDELGELASLMVDVEQGIRPLSDALRVARDVEAAA
jgi:L-alanine-DL-glutamate epimerase-like enolase superfamily enzyme